MNIEEKIFKNAKIDLEKLRPYGFKKVDDGYIYSTYILNGLFEIIIMIDSNRKVSGKIMDCNFHEEYVNYRNENLNGEFVNKVRNEFKNVLTDIRDNCAILMYFKGDQTNKIVDFIINYYHTIPEFPWKKDPYYGVFRHINNKKWYALIMNLKRGTIEDSDNMEEVEVINLKLNEDTITNLLNKQGYYKAYHMNKKKWITIILDDTVKDEEIIFYIQESYNLTQGKTMK